MEAVKSLLAAHAMQQLLEMAKNLLGCSNDGSTTLSVHKADVGSMVD